MVLLLGAAGLRLVRIDQPSRIAFDENHYVTDAREYLDRGVEIDRPAHPPAGKWIIAASMRVAGDRPLGWRLGSALGGVAAVGATYLMGRRLFRPRWAAVLAGGLVAVDGVSVVMSRIGMLDGIQAGLVAVGALFSLSDRQSSHRRWRWATGVVLGIALAVKWSTVPVLAVVLGVAVLSDLGGRVPRWSEVPTVARRTLVPLLVVPFLVYVGTYASWFVHIDESETGRQRCRGDGCSVQEAISGWTFEQWDMWDLQGRLEATHPDRARPLAWLAATRPVMTYAAGCPATPEPGDACEVPPGLHARTLTVGNPALWWPALLAFPYVAWKALRRRDGEAAFVGALLGAQVLPWFLTPNPGFSFYLAPVVPFAALALVLALVDLARRWRWGHLAPTLVAVAALACAVALYPIWTGLPLSSSALDDRLWLDGWR